jgi:2-keto-3-deoxy-L-rhamnonate aldolase RhmA
LGPCITLTDPRVTDALGDSVDFFWIDLEHSPMGGDALLGHILAARRRNVPSLVRVPASGEAFIKPVLDGGADGIIVPQIRSAEEARGAVADCRYPPLGRRGYLPRVPSNYGRDGGKAYMERANADVFVALQIENVEGLAALEEIIAIPGLDSVVLGPWDLSGSMGHPGGVDHPDVYAAVERVIARARAAGLFIGAGTLAIPEHAARMIRRGIHWMQVGTDYEYLVKTADQVYAAVRSQLGQ